jgi:hypothetical protein
MTFSPFAALKRAFRSLFLARERTIRRYPDAAEPPHEGWTGHSLAIEAALATGLDGSTGVLVALWPGDHVSRGRAGTFIPEWQKSYSGK